MEELWKSYTRPGARLALACGTSPSINAHALGRPRMVSRARAHARTRARTYTRTRARAHARAHARTRAYARTRARTYAAILKGKYPFSLPPERAVYLTSVRDMGRLAGACLAGEPPPAAGGRTLNVASELTSPAGMAAAFAEAQGAPCVHKQAQP